MDEPAGRTPANEPAREVRTRPCGTVECPACGRPVKMTQETVEWTQRRDGSWKHHAYGPPTGDCCNLAFFDDAWDGVQVFRIPEPAKEGRNGHL